MNDLLALQNALLHRLGAHPQTQLALLCALLDPFPDLPDEVDDDPLIYLISQLRLYAPHIYTEAVEALLNGKDTQAIEEALCQRLQALGLPIESAEEALFGVPMPAYGMPWECEDWVEDHADWLEIMVLFGFDPDENEPNEAQKLAQIVFLTLESHADPQIQALGCAVGFLFSTTGNSTVDFSAEAMSELNPLQWDDLDFALEIIEEAQAIMEKAQIGLKHLQDKAAQKWLSQVITLTDRALRERGNYREPDRLAEQLRPRIPAFGGSLE